MQRSFHETDRPAVAGSALLAVAACAAMILTPAARAAVLDIPAGDYTVADANISSLAAYDAINLADESSRLVFDLASDASLACFVTNKGAVVKRGAGKLTLTNGTLGTGFHVEGGWHVEDGTLEFPKEPSATTFSYSLEVSAPGVFCVPTHSSKTITSKVSFLGGDGLVTNTISQISDGKMVFLVASGSFCGTISRFIKERISGTFNMYGTDNSAGNELSIGYEQQGILGAFSNDSIGNGYQIKFNGGNSTLRYLGAGGDVFEKRFSAAERNSVLDGGNGGLTVTPTALTLSSAKIANFTLTGSAGTNILNGSNITGTRGRIVKDGTCAWFLRRNRWGWKNGGSVEARSGKLMIDHLDDRNYPCPLGFGTNPTKSPPWAVNYAASHDVPYGVLLSGGELEYVGTTNQAFAADRGIGVSADSRLTDNGAARFGFDGVSCVDSTPRTLTLGGSSALSHLFNVTDGDAALSLVKEGTGTWTLGGALSFSGALRVREGKVVVKTDSADAKYTWFRLTVMENCSVLKTKDNANQVGIGDWGLFDASGNRLGGSVTNSPTFGTADLRPNEVAWGWNAELFNHADAHNAYTPAAMFYDASDKTPSTGRYYGKSIVSSGVYEAPRYDQTNTWQRFVVRLPADTAEIASYDLTTFLASGQAAIITWRLEGSRDGFHWDILDDQYRNANATNSTRTISNWISDLSEVVRPAGAHTGFPITGHAAGVTVAEQLRNATVEVAPGAELAADGAVEINRLFVDPATGAGTLRGFTFASSGILELPEEPSGAISFRIGVEDSDDFADVSNWTLAADGVEYPRVLISAHPSGRITLGHQATVIAFR